MKFRLLYQCAIVTSLAITSALTFAQEVKRPNFVWIISEDNSSHYLKHFSDNGINTPNISALAESGLTFDNAYSNSPVCSVARTTLATGVYAPSIGTQFHRADAKLPQTKNIKLFQSYLSQNGYYTTNNAKTDYNVVADKQQGWHQSSKQASWRDRNNANQPFFHVETHHDSHEGRLHFKDKQYQQEVKPETLADINVPDYLPDTQLSRFTYQKYLQKMVQIDGKVGATVEKLRKDGLLDDTFIFYFGDHGGVLPRSKGYLFDAGLRVPLVVHVPKNFEHLVNAGAATRVQGTVEFVDFAPTLLTLAGIELPTHLDGKAFLGENVSLDEVNSRDESIAYADRFDEKYDLVRSLKKGNFRYVRNYQSYLPNGLQNNYRYRMLAYQEWRQLHKQGKLNAVQSQFFNPKPVEQLFDTSKDPHEVNNLAADPKYKPLLTNLRARLQTRLLDLPDLGVYPESYLIRYGMPNIQEFAQKNKAHINKLFAIADLSLLPFNQAKPQLEKALQSSDPMQRYWAVTAAINFGEQAKTLLANIKPLVNDPEVTVRIRVAEYFGVIGYGKPQKILSNIVNSTLYPTVAAEAFNAIVYLHDFSDGKYPADVENLKPKIKGRGINWRMMYLKSL
ncbi:sulfatase-like hydrolase/transferase [Parashewanella tropica]|uniref:sulfatase-like hydrolase/transferase n=1 Tax=Parashewanella tropica TaxID=2547970 RepID=UPI0014782C2D|nr:sulfatase-like hydrolase/transferase [Parashewanella tropica]